MQTQETIEQALNRAYYLIKEADSRLQRGMVSPEKMKIAEAYLKYAKVASKVKKNADPY